MVNCLLDFQHEVVGGDSSTIGGLASSFWMEYGLVEYKVCVRALLRKTLRTVAGAVASCVCLRYRSSVFASPCVISLRFMLAADAFVGCLDAYKK